MVLWSSCFHHVFDEVVLMRLSSSKGAFTRMKFTWRWNETLVEIKNHFAIFSVYMRVMKRFRRRWELYMLFLLCDTFVVSSSRDGGIERLIKENVNIWWDTRWFFNGKLNSTGFFTGVWDFTRVWVSHACRLKIHVNRINWTKEILKATSNISRADEFQLDLKFQPPAKSLL